MAAEKVVRASRSATEKSKTTRPHNTSGESLYEDAVSQPLPNSTQVIHILLNTFLTN